MVFIVRFTHLMRSFNMHRILLVHSDKMSRSSFSCLAHRLVYSSIEIIIYMKLECQLQDRGSLNFGPLRISDLRLSLLTIQCIKVKYITPVITRPVGLKLKEEEEKERVGGLPFRCSTETHIRVCWFLLFFFL